MNAVARGCGRLLPFPRQDSHGFALFASECTSFGSVSTSFRGVMTIADRVFASFLALSDRPLHPLFFTACSCPWKSQANRDTGRGRVTIAMRFCCDS